MNPPRAAEGRRWRGLLATAPWVMAVASGLLLSAAYAPINKGELAWFALVPLLISAKFVEPRRLFLLGLASGAAFWLVSVFWLTRVTGFGWFGLALYCAAYTGLFTWLVGLRLQRAGTQSFIRNMLTMLLAAAAWTGAEYLRATLASGFPWNPLGLSQYANLPVIQFAAWGGVYLVSAMVVWVNIGVALTALRYFDAKGRWGRRPNLELAAALLLLAAAFVTGWKIARFQPAGDTLLRAAVIQTGIPQDDKWDAAKVKLIYQRLWELTTTALSTEPHLIIWPETALPDDVRGSPASADLVFQLATNGVPLLVGSMDTEWPDAGSPVYYNSSFLFDADGAIAAEYRKRHLVPFGEYVPFRKALPFMKAMTPIQESFDGGRTSSVFRLASPAVAFAALICFEDSVPALARESVRNGARLLINQTNDAWFDPWWAQWQHMAQSVLRAVENGVPVIRCANTGVSCFIDRSGRVLDVLEEGGRVGFPGFRTSEVAVPMGDYESTFYTRHGDVFALTCAFATLLAALAAWRSLRAGPGLRP